MYYIKLDKYDYEDFKRSAKSKMALLGMKPEELAEATGYSVRTIYSFFCKTNSKFVAYAIADVLEMEGWQVCGLE